MRSRSPIGRLERSRLTLPPRAFFFGGCHSTHARMPIARGGDGAALFSLREAFARHQRSASYRGRHPEGGALYLWPTAKLKLG